MSTTNPSVGGTFTITGTNWQPGTTVDITLHSQVYDLGSATVGANGSFTKTVTLPAGVSGAHEIVLTDTTTGKTASIAITIGTTAPPASSGSGGGGLATTGVAIIGIGSVGLILLVGGGIMLLVGRRRRISA